MSSPDSSNFAKYLAITIAVVALSAGSGYLVAGLMKPQPRQETQKVATTTTDTDNPRTESATSPTPAKPQENKPKDNDFTAPGAPHISIEEEKAPASKDSSTVASDNKNDKDPDAGQEGVTTGDTKQNTSPDSDNMPSAVTQPSSGSNNNDPDYEQTGPTVTNEPSQSGESSTGRAQYRVMVGTFDQKENARNVSDVLSKRKYATTTTEEHKGDRIVYHVQVGAYRSKTSAEKISNDLQSQGYPAFITTIKD